MNITSADLSVIALASRRFGRTNATWAMSQHIYLSLWAMDNRYRNARHTQKAQRRARKATRRRNNGRRP